MFASPKKTLENVRIDTIIGPSSKLEGNINVSGTVRIDGSYKGDIYAEDDVIVGETGIVFGNIFSNNVSITGRVEGNISCKGVLEILSKGRLIGDIEVRNISISDGAVFNGKCNMIADEIEIQTA